MKKPRCKCKRYYLSWEDPVFHEPGRYYFFKVNRLTITVKKMHDGITQLI